MANLSFQLRRRPLAFVSVVPWVLAACWLGACGGATDNGPGPDGLLVDSGDLLPEDTPVESEEERKTVYSGSPATVVTLAPAEIQAGQTLSVTCQVQDQEGADWPLDDDTEFEIIASPTSPLRRLQGELVAVQAGVVDLSCSLPELSLIDDTPQRVVIAPGPPAVTVTRLDRLQLIAGETVTASCAVYDEFGNRRDDTTPTLLVQPVESQDQVEGLTATLTRQGRYALACDLAGTESATVPVEVLPALPAHMTVATAPATAWYRLGQVVEVQTVVTDRFNNVIADAPLRFNSTPQGVRLGRSRWRYFTEGTYLLEASVDGITDDDQPVTAAAEVVINGHGPTIECGAIGGGPLSGEMVEAAPGSTVPFSGTVVDANGVAGLTVNGREVEVDEEGHFATTVPVQFGTNFVDIVATDHYGEENSRHCTFLAANRWVAEGDFLAHAVSLTLLQEAIDDGQYDDGLDSLNDVLHALVTSPGLRDSLHQALVEANPVIPTTCARKIFGACVFKYRVNYVDSEFRGAQDTSITLVDGGISVAVHFDELRLRLRIGGTLDSTGWASLRDVSLRLTFDVALRDGRPRVNVRTDSVEVGIGGISTDFSGVSGWLIDIVARFIRGTIRNQVTGALKGYLTNNFDELLDGLLASLDVSQLGSTFTVPTLTGGGLPLAFGLRFSDVQAREGRLTFGLATRFSTTAAHARGSRGAAVPPGAPYNDSTAREPATASVQVALLNTILHTLWRGGLFTGRIGAETLGATLVGGLDVQAEIDAALPPVVALAGDGTEPGTVELTLGSLQIVLSLPDLLNAPLALEVGARAGAKIRLDDGRLRFEQLQLEEVFVDSAEVPLNGATRSALEDLLRSLVQRLLDQSLNDSLPALPLPSFTLPREVAPFGLPAEAELGLVGPTLDFGEQHLVLQGQFGVVGGSL
jgi:hypothetical protein